MILLVDHYRNGVVVAEEDCPALLGADEIRADKMALDHRDPDSVRYLVEVDAVEPDIAAFERFFQTGKEGVAVLATSLMKEWVHLKSDVNTKNSLPFPIVSTVSPELANTLADYGVDMGNILAVSKQFVYAEGINIIIEILHGLYCIYSESSNPESELMAEEVKMQLNLLKIRTKKIVMWSNVIASTSNLLAVSAMEAVAVAIDNPLLAAKGKSYLDIGGYVATLHRLISDKKFINQVKTEFVMKEWENLIIGEDYSFVEGKRDEQEGLL